MIINEIKKLRFQHQVMALPCDLKVTAKLINLLPNRTLLEFGTGSGGWPHVNTLIGAQFDKCYLIDNFSWANEPTAKDVSEEHVNKWMQTPEDLQTYLQANMKTNTVVAKLDTLNDDVSSVLKNMITDTIGILRIDCILHFETLLETIDQFMDPRTAVIFIDDIKLNGGFERVRTLFRLIEGKGWHTLWFGEKECAIVKDSNLQVELFDKLADLIFTDDELLVIKERSPWGRFLSSRYLVG